MLCLCHVSDACALPLPCVWCLCSASAMRLMPVLCLCHVSDACALPLPCVWCLCSASAMRLMPVLCLCHVSDACALPLRCLGFAGLAHLSRQVSILYITKPVHYIARLCFVSVPCLILLCCASDTSSMRLCWLFVAEIMLLLCL